jgi:hypothetical protein
MDDLTQLGLFVGVAIILTLLADGFRRVAEVLESISGRLRPWRRAPHVSMGDPSTPDRLVVSRSFDIGNASSSPPGDFLTDRLLSDASHRSPLESHLLWRNVWLLLGTASVVVAFIFVAASNFSVLRSLGWSSDTSSVTLISVSIVFTGTVVSCFFLLAARINAFTAMNKDLAVVDRNISRAESHARAIKKYGKVSENGSHRRKP